MTLAVATVVYRPDDANLNELVHSFQLTGLEAFVFVNGPISDGAERILAQMSRSHVTRSATNIGLGAALNAVSYAARTAGISHLLLFDQDSAPAPALAEKLLRRFLQLSLASGEKLAALGPLLVAPEGENYLQPWYSRRAGMLADNVALVDFLPTSGTMISLDAFEAIGPFRDDYFVDGIDVEWCFRAWSLGFSCALAQTLTMPHRWGHADDGRTPQILRQSPLRCYYYLRNATHGLRLAHLPWPWRIKTALRLAAQAALLLYRRRFSRSTRTLIIRSFRDGWRGKLGPAPVFVTTRFDA